MDEVGAGWGRRLGSWLDRRHPFVSAILGCLVFAVSGGVAAAFAGVMVKADGARLPYVLAGVALGACGAGLWLYAFAKGFDVSLALGRAIFGLTLAAAAAAFGALLLGPPVQVFCAAVVAARLLPQAVFAIVQGLQDVRDPVGRAGRVRRAMTMARRK
jgi:hypothetical protein